MVSKICRDRFCQRLLAFIEMQNSCRYASNISARVLIVRSDLVNKQKEAVFLLTVLLFKHFVDKRDDDFFLVDNNE